MIHAAVRTATHCDNSFVTHTSCTHTNWLHHLSAPSHASRPDALARSCCVDDIGVWQRRHLPRHATPGEPCGCRPSLGPRAGVWPSWPLARRSQALVKGHLAAVMRWRAPIERPAKGEAVIGWRRDAAAGGGGADRGAVCAFELKQNVSTVSPRLPSAPREVTQSDRSLGAFTRKHNTASSLLPTCHCLAATPSAGPNGNSDGYQGGLLISPG